MALHGSQDLRSLTRDRTHAPLEWEHRLNCWTTRELPQSDLKQWKTWGFPGGSMVMNLPADAGDAGSIPDAGRSHMP